MESGGIQPDLGCSGSSPASHSWALDPQSHVVFSAKKGPGAGSLPATRVCWAGPRAQAVFFGPNFRARLVGGFKRTSGFTEFHDTCNEGRFTRNMPPPANPGVRRRHPSMDDQTLRKKTP